MYNRNRRGLRTNPCGTPHFISFRNKLLPIREIASKPIKWWSSDSIEFGFVQENFVINRVKGFFKVNKNAYSEFVVFEMLRNVVD